MHFVSNTVQIRLESNFEFQFSIRVQDSIQDFTLLDINTVSFKIRICIFEFKTDIRIKKLRPWVYLGIPDSRVHLFKKCLFRE